MCSGEITRNPIPQQFSGHHHQGLDLCARLLLKPNDAFVFDDPGYRMARYSFQATGAVALP
ncbi:hypothetical protein PchlO6_3552 [Pseudomonas chlororaphis O6]|uniref:Uncharacterized protein n=1 Tax=Pseudomonas chlororaphis O6 TaxID=1037915 RepID=A0AB33WPS0_9PSED|nr:hypothetical protein PchlO6_3552 [Pseudomonas chlororaphis O6]